MTALPKFRTRQKQLSEDSEKHAFVFSAREAVKKTRTLEKHKGAAPGASTISCLNHGDHLDSAGSSLCRIRLNAISLRVSLHKHQKPFQLMLCL
jgi:hypothetical protein